MMIFPKCQKPFVDFSVQNCQLVNILFDMAERLNNIKDSLKGDSQNRLSEIRTRTKLDADDLKTALYVDDNYEKYIKPAWEYYSSNKDTFIHQNIEAFNRSEQRIQGVKMVIAAMKHFKLDLENEPEKFIHSSYTVCAFDNGLLLKFLLQYMFYSNCILLYGTTPYHKELLERARKLEDLGAFGLTQFYHGSFSKGIQTKAYYNHANKTFTLTTDGTKGMKYWIGGVAETMTTSVMWAQLIVDGVSHGPHPFIFPIRCQKTHKILPGITIGDCGPKNAHNLVDNGYIIIDNVTIPKENLLDKLGGIDEQGKYYSMVEDKDKRFGYHMSPLSGGRGLLSYVSNGAALCATTVALRYTCSRRQFSTQKNTPEIPVIDYQLTRNRLIPNLVTVLLQLCPTGNMSRGYFSKESIFNHPHKIEELHALSAAMKVRVSTNATVAAEESRTLLGGHGYSMYSNIVQMYHGIDLLKTGEGDNNMLLQQSSNFLMRAIPKQKKTYLLDLSFAWKQLPALNEEQAASSLRSLATLETLLQHLFVSKYENAKNTLEQLTKAFPKRAEMWLHFHPQAGNPLSLSYAEMYIFAVAKERISVSKSAVNKEFLTKCTLLWGYGVVERERFGSLAFRRTLQKEIIVLSNQLVDGVVAATDIIAPPSFVIGSVFADEAGEGFREYLNTIFTAKNAFSRPQYYQEIIESRKS